jgi:hypothetical protein
MADSTKRGEQDNEAVAMGRRLRRGFWLGIISAAFAVSIIATVAAYADALAPAGSAGGEEPAGGAVVDIHSSSTVTRPTTVASSWTQSPTFVPPAPAAALSPEAEALVAEANARSGVRIVTEGQDWGDDGAAQAANIGAVISAWQRLPLRVTSSVVDHPHGALQVLSNEQGRTSGGWQPYGDVSVSFYTNSDQGIEGYRPANQIVLATGSGEETVLHELLHAYAFRNVDADEYVAAFLDGEMRSFMQASGWRLLVSDATLLANAHRPWDEVNALFAYEGSGPGNAANPLEGFATAGAKFYTSAGSGAEWPEFAWFEENLS